MQFIKKKIKNFEQNSQSNSMLWYYLFENFEYARLGRWLLMNFKSSFLPLSCYELV